DTVSSLHMNASDQRKCSLNSTAQKLPSIPISVPTSATTPSVTKLSRWKIKPEEESERSGNNRRRASTKTGLDETDIQPTIDVLKPVVTHVNCNMADEDKKKRKRRRKAGYKGCIENN
ncbi:unnamed protein product, partial [Didymodactylos carnosus]